MNLMNVQCNKFGPMVLRGEMGTTSGRQLLMLTAVQNLIF